MKNLTRNEIKPVQRTSIEETFPSTQRENKDLPEEERNMVLMTNFLR